MSFADMLWRWNQWLHFDFPSSFLSFEGKVLLVYDLFSIQDATVRCRYAELVGDQLRLELISTFPLEHVTEFFLLEERMSAATFDEIGAVRKNI